MLIRNITDEKAIGLIREWNGQAPGDKMADSEKAFRAMCDRYVLVEVETAQELARLNSMEKYITGGHGFYLYVRYPVDVLETIRMGRAALPAFVHRAEERYSSAYSRGSLKLLLGFLQEAMDPNYDIGLFIDIMGQTPTRTVQPAVQSVAQPVAQPAVQPVAQPAVQPVVQAAMQQTAARPAYQRSAAQQSRRRPVYQQERYAQSAQQQHYRQTTYQQPAYQPAAYSQDSYPQPQQPQPQRTTKVIHYHFGNQVS